MNDIFLSVFLVFCGLSWITHIVSCLLTAKYMLLLAGAFIFPVGIIHGAGVLFGVNW